MFSYHSSNNISKLLAENDAYFLELERERQSRILKSRKMAMNFVPTMGQVDCKYFIKIRLDSIVILFTAFLLHSNLVINGTTAAFVINGTTTAFLINGTTAYFVEKNRSAKLIFLFLPNAYKLHDPKILIL
jgi:hypothetical protein